MKLVLPFIVTLLIISCISFGNGGPIDLSKTVRTGFPQFLEVRSASVQSQILHITFKDDFAHVKVIYKMKASASDSLVYGFPIDFAVSGRNEVEGYEDKRDTVKLKNLTFKKNSFSLRVMNRMDLGIQTVHVPFQGILIAGSREYVISNKNECKRIWHFTKLSYERDEEFELTVEYDYRCSFEDWAFSKSYYTIFSSRQLIYDFTGAKHWASDQNNSLSVEIDFGEIGLAGDSVQMMWFEKDFVPVSGSFKKVLKGFQYSDIPPLCIKYSAEGIKNAATMKENKGKEVLSPIVEREPNQAYAFDGNANTSWKSSKIGKGVGSTLNVHCTDGYGAMRIINGNRKTEADFYNYSRVKKLRIQSDLGFYDMDTDSSSTYIDIELPDNPFNEILPQNLFVQSIPLFDRGDSGRFEEHLTFTILEVYEGRKYNNVCISDIYFLKW
ncbi:MAG: NADase-type glycan-binding domain-containing protein [Flavobacteriales bacterium]